MLGGLEQVALENAALRQQLAVFKREVKRPRLLRRDRLFWIALRTIWNDWRSALVIVRPETVISWQRRRFKRYWWKLSQSKGPGRPRVSLEIRKLVRNMVAANPLWGAPRIHGELLKLGFEISERTVFTTDAEKRQKPCANMDHISAQSCWPTGLRGFLHRCNDSVTRAVRLRHPVAGPSSCPALQRH